jgi:hypothetical protein
MPYISKPRTRAATRATRATMRSHVQLCQPFKGSNVFAGIAFDTHEPTTVTVNGQPVQIDTQPIESTRRYVVYSYGRHFPIYIYVHCADKWFVNKDKYSPTTSRHQSCCNPYVDADKQQLLNTADMRLLAEHGFPEFMRVKALSASN